MANKIVVNPAELKAVSSKMNSQIEEYQKLYNSIFSEVDGLAKAWQGKDNIAYTTQIQGFKDDFVKMTSTLREYSEFLKDSANKYTSTQEQIVAEAKRLQN